jgi:C4-type Zn-finger protein
LPDNIQVYDHTLIFPRVTRENQGVYTLMLNDNFGTARIQISVIVDETMTTTRDPKLPKKFIVRESTDIELEAGQNANIICKLRPKSYQVN